MTNVLLINDTASQGNWGDRAAAASLRAMITELGGKVLHSITERDIASSSFFGPPGDLESPMAGGIREVLRPYVPPVVLEARRKIQKNIAGSRRAAVIPFEWDGFEASARTVLGKANPWPELVPAIESSDLAIIHGDGSMVGNGLNPRTLLFFAYLIKRHFGKRVAIVNHSADFDHPALLEMAQNVYPLFDDVVFRDPVSVERWESLGGGRFAADTGFWFAPIARPEWIPVANRLTFFDVWPDRAQFDPSLPYLCLGGSSLYIKSTDPMQVTGQWSRLVEHLRSVYAGEIVLTASDWIDEVVFRPLAARLELPLLGVRTPTQQAVDILGNADAYIGGRWHPAIFALRGGTPLVSLSAKTFKMQALSEMAGLSSPKFDAFDLDGDRHAIGRQLRLLLDQGGELRTRLRTWAEDMCGNSWDNLRCLSDSSACR